jgi:hypothetical protein
MPVTQKKARSMVGFLREMRNIRYGTMRNSRNPLTANATLLLVRPAGIEPARPKGERF